MSKSKILACPFCGKPVRLSRPFCPQEIVQIKCENPYCEINPEVRTSPEQHAIELWNLRAGDRQPAPPETETPKGGCAPVSCSAATSDWKPIFEAPTENGHYLVWVKDGGAGWADQACIEWWEAKREWQGESGIIEDGGEITHWAKILPPNESSSGTATTNAAGLGQNRK